MLSMIDSSGEMNTQTFARDVTLLTRPSVMRAVENRESSGSVGNVVAHGDCETARSGVQTKCIQVRQLW